MPPDSSPSPVFLTVELTDDEAWSLAQFLKRVGLSDFRANAQDDIEAYAMKEHPEKLHHSASGLVLNALMLAFPCP